MRLVKSIALRVDGEQAFFDLQAENDPAVDVWGAERKADLWLKVFGLRPVFRWANAPAGEPERGQSLQAQGASHG